MSTAGGPRLAGIGRTGDSDIVLCMDAHDAGSYPGEPTTNLIAYPHYTGATLDTGQTGTNGGWGATWVYEISEIPGPNGTLVRALSIELTVVVSPFIYSCNGAPYNVTGINSQYAAMTSGTEYTASCWAKVERVGGGSHTDENHIYFTGAASYGTASTTVNPEWTHISATLTPGVTGNYRLAHYFYSAAIGDKIWFTMPQIEQKGYATPFVRSQLLDFSQQGYRARPPSVNLMIHGDVGSGSSFEDSSPSKHTITAVGSVAHSATKSKFSGGSIYFDSDLLTIPTSSDWDFGTADFTVDLWTNVDSGSIQDDTFFSTLPGGASPVGLCLSLRQTEPFSLGIYTSIGYLGNGSVGNYTARAIYTNIWYHIALVRADGVFYFYVDGTNVGTVSGYTSLNLDTDQPFYMGRFYTNSGGYYLNGFMDEIRVTKGTALWTHPFTPPTRRNRSAPVVDLSGHHQGGNFATTDMTDTKTNRRGQVIEPVASAVWDFDGTDDFINLGKMVDPATTIGTNGTMCLWINPAVVDTSDYIWSKNVSSSGTTYIICKFTANDYVEFRMYGSWGWGPQIYTGVISPNTWTYIVCTWYTDGYALYKDGVLADSAVESGIWGGAGSTEIWLGENDSNDASQPFQGKMGAVALYKSSLSATQIKQNFNSQRSRFKV